MATNITELDLNTNLNKTTLAEPARYVGTKELEDINKQYDKNLIDYYIENLGNLNTEEIDRLFRARENQIEESDYEHIINPFKFDKNLANDVKTAAKLKSYPLISTVIDTMLSEYSRRPKIARVIGLGENFDTLYKEGVSAIINQALQQIFINEMNASGFPTGEESVPEEQVEQEKNAKLENLIDILVEEGQNALEVLKNDLDLNDKLQQAYNFWLITGIVVTYKEVNEYGIDYQIINPKKVRFDFNNDTTYIEDLNEFIRVENYSLNELVDRFDLTKNEIDALCDAYPYSIDINGFVNFKSERDTKYTEGQANTLKTGFTCYHVVYTVNRKIGILSYISELTGDLEEMEVDDTYKLNKEAGDLEISYKYNTEIREGWRIEDVLYKDIREIPVPREEVNTFVQQKLPYNGRWTKTNTNEIYSVVKTGLSFAFMYNYVNYKFEKILNKSKDKLTFMPQSLIPNNKHISTDKFFWMLDNLSMGIYDDSSPNAIAKMQGLKAIDVSLLDYAKSTYEILNLIKQEYWDAVGFNRQRQGAIYASDGKANTEQAIYRSSMITEETTRKFDTVYQKDLNGLLDYTKVTWLKGKKAKFLNSERKVITLNIVGEDWVHKDWAIFIGNPVEEQEKLDALKPLALGFLQNSAEHKEVIADVIDADNITKLKKILRNYDEKVEEKFLQEQAAIQEQNQLKQQEIEMMSQKEDEKRTSDEQIEYAKLDTQKEIAFAKLEHEALNTDDKKSFLEEAKFKHQQEKDRRELSLKEKMHSDKMVLENKKLNKPKTS
jgi:hypothetical protein